MPADGRSVLDHALSKASPWVVALTSDGEPILPRRVYLAPPIITSSSAVSACAGFTLRVRTGPVRRSILCFVQRRGAAVA
jgi:hypothetical protein